MEPAEGITVKRKNLIRRDPSKAEVSDHLGGGRERCHFDPTVLTYLKDTFDIETMLDVGCGLGCTVMAARELGLKAWGVDGDPYCRPDILHDFSDGPMENSYPFLDLVWSMEFLEHVEERFMPNYMPAFQAGKYAFVTFAPPGKKGHHHVNCQPQNYWVDRFAEYGFTWLQAETAHIRDISDIQTIEANGTVRPKSRKRFIKDYGLLFRRG